MSRCGIVYQIVHSARGIDRRWLICIQIWIIIGLVSVLSTKSSIHKTVPLSLPRSRMMFIQNKALAYVRTRYMQLLNSYRTNENHLAEFHVLYCRLLSSCVSLRHPPLRQFRAPSRFIHGGVRRPGMWQYVLELYVLHKYYPFRKVDRTMANTLWEIENKSLAESKNM